MRACGARYPAPPDFLSRWPSWLGLPGGDRHQSRAITGCQTFGRTGIMKRVLLLLAAAVAVVVGVVVVGLTDSDRTGVGARGP